MNGGFKDGHFYHDDCWARLEPWSCMIEFQCSRFFQFPSMSLSSQVRGCRDLSTSCRSSGDSWQLEEACKTCARLWQGSSINDTIVLNLVGLINGTIVLNLVGLINGTIVLSLVGLINDTIVLSLVGLINGTFVLSLVGLINGTFVLSLVGLTNGTFVLSVVGLINGTFVLSLVGLINGTFVLSLVGLINGTFVLSLVGLTNGTFVLSLVGLINGTFVLSLVGLTNDTEHTTTPKLGWMTMPHLLKVDSYTAHCSTCFSRAFPHTCSTSTFLAPSFVTICKNAPYG